MVGIGVSTSQVFLGSYFSVPADRCFVQVDVNLFGFEIFFNAPRAELASESGLFVASPGSLDISRLHMVNPDDSGTQGLHRTESLEDVTGPDGGGQAVR